MEPATKQDLKDLLKEFRESLKQDIKEAVAEAFGNSKPALEHASTPAASQLLPTDAPASPTTTVDVVPVLAASSASAKPLDIDATGVAAPTPTTCSTDGHGHDTDGYGSLAVSLPCRLFTASRDASLIQPCRRFVVRGPDKMTPTRCSAIFFDDDIDMLTHKFKLEVTPSIKTHGQELRPAPWPSFRCHSGAEYPMGPCSATQVQGWVCALPAHSRLPDMMNVTPSWVMSSMVSLTHTKDTHSRVELRPLPWPSFKCSQVSTVWQLEKIMNHTEVPSVGITVQDTSGENNNIYIPSLYLGSVADWETLFCLCMRCDTASYCFKHLVHLAAGKCLLLIRHMGLFPGDDLLFGGPEIILSVWPLECLQSLQPVLPWLTHVGIEVEERGLHFDIGMILQAYYYSLRTHGYGCYYLATGDTKGFRASCLSWKSELKNLVVQKYNLKDFSERHLCGPTASYLVLINFGAMGTGSLQIMQQLRNTVLKGTRLSEDISAKWSSLQQHNTTNLWNLSCWNGRSFLFIIHASLGGFCRCNWDVRITASSSIYLQLHISLTFGVLLNHPSRMGFIILGVLSDADAYIQEREAYYAECHSALVAMLDIGLMQWMNSWLVIHTLFFEFRTYFAPEMVNDNDKLSSEFVQWEIAWATRLASMKLWFPFYYAGLDSLFGCENFQWTIAWSLSSHSPVTSLQTRSVCVSFLMQHNCLSIYHGIWFRLMMGKLTSDILMDIAYKLACAITYLAGGGTPPYLAAVDSFHMDTSCFVLISSGASDFHPRSARGQAELHVEGIMRNQAMCSVDQYIHQQLLLEATTLRYIIILDSPLDNCIDVIHLSLLLPWDPGGEEFVEYFMQTKAERREEQQVHNLLRQPVFCFALTCSFKKVPIDHKFYFVFDQVRAGNDNHIHDAASFNLAQVYFNIGYLRECRLSWDPGDKDSAPASAWGQAEFQGGRSVREPIYPYWAGASTVDGLSPIAITGWWLQIYRGRATRRLSWMDHGTAAADSPPTSGSHPLPLSCCFLFEHTCACINIQSYSNSCIS